MVKFPDPCHIYFRKNKGIEEPSVFVQLALKENNSLLETIVEEWRKQLKTM
jgi:hypothetical protein